MTNNLPIFNWLTNFFKSQASVQKVFKSANVPIHFDVLENFSWEDPVTRERLKKNRVILLGVVPPHGKGSKVVENYQFY